MFDEMKRGITLITVPYDSGHRARRMGAGPLRILEAGAVDRLTSAGHDVRHVPVELPDRFWTEVAAAQRLQQLVADATRDAVARGDRPIILSGNCNSSVGTTAGLGLGGLGVVWLDAHPDLETPETTTSGFFDGQALATITGRCWRQIAATVPGFAEVPDDRVMVVGGRDASDAESALLRGSRMAWVREPMLHGGGVASEAVAMLDRLARLVQRVYLHVDLDVHGAQSLRANGYASTGGPTPREILRFVEMVAKRFNVAAAAITAFDPSADDDGRALTAALSLLDALAGEPIHS